MNETDPCPRCGEPLTRTPALSRWDNKSKVCPKCGQMEGLWQAQHPGEDLPSLDYLLHT